jgi:hypothetical protein
MANVILTRSMAGMVGASMPEPTASEKYPAMRFHATLPPVTVQNEEEEKALPAGYRAKVWSEEEIAAARAPQTGHPASAVDEPDEPHAPRSRR